MIWNIKLNIANDNTPTIYTIYHVFYFCLCPCFATVIIQSRKRLIYFPFFFFEKQSSLHDLIDFIVNEISVFGKKCMHKQIHHYFNFSAQQYRRGIFNTKSTLIRNLCGHPVAQQRGWSLSLDYPPPLSRVKCMYNFIKCVFIQSRIKYSNWYHDYRYSRITLSTER